jgi:hypothetical protein
MPRRSPAPRHSSTTASTTAPPAGRRCRARSIRRSATRSSAATSRSTPADVTFPLGPGGQNDSRRRCGSTGRKRVARRSRR